MSLPIRTRLTMWYVALLVAILVAAGWFVIWRTRSDLVAHLDQTLRSSANEIASDYHTTGGGESEFRDVSDASLAGLPRDGSTAQVLGPDGVPLVWSGNGFGQRALIDAAARSWVRSGDRIMSTAVLGPRRSAYRLVAVPIEAGGSTQVLVVATSLADVNQTVHALLVLFLVGGAVAVLAAAVGGVWLARSALRPVATMTQEAAEIGVRRLDDRVEVPPTKDELQRLALTLNAMLDRLQRGVEQERRFVSDASHELRTPLAVMRSEIEVSLGAPDLTPESREVLESACEETERMAKIVEDLLTLARIDEGGLALQLERIDLATVAHEVVTSIGSLAARRGISIEIDAASAVVEADRARLAQVVTNFIENAVRYAGVDGTISVRVRRAGDEAVCEVRDSGTGIAPELLPHVFDRFYRADPARTREEGGSGLGLAICREIAEAHHGRVWATSGIGHGSSFFLALPTVAADAREPTLSR